VFKNLLLRVRAGSKLQLLMGENQIAEHLIWTVASQQMFKEKQNDEKKEKRTGIDAVR